MKENYTRRLIITPVPTEERNNIYQSDINQNQTSERKSMVSILGGGKSRLELVLYIVT
jgi:hypothetical protein